MAIENVSVNQPSRSRPTSRLFGQFIIKHRFQFKFSIILFFILACSTLILWLESHLAVAQLIDSGAVYGQDAILQLQLLSKIIGKTGFLIMGITFGVTLFLSHFVAGPIYRFERTFQEMQTGNLAVYIRLRKHDELQDSADIFNQALASVRNKIKKEREASAETLNKIKALSQEMRMAGHVAEADRLDQLLVEFGNLPPQLKIS